MEDEFIDQLRETFTTIRRRTQAVEMYAGTTLTPNEKEVLKGHLASISTLCIAAIVTLEEHK